MAGPSEVTPILPQQNSQGSEEHFPEPEFQGHGNRMSNKRSTRRSVETTTNDNESVVDWKDPEDGDSDFSALMNLVTGAIGSGVVYLPAAAGECGLALGLIIITFCGLVSAHSTTIIGTVMLMARNLANKKGFEGAVETFEDISKVIWGAVGFWIISFINYLDLYLTVAVFMGTLADTTNDAIAAVTGAESQTWWFNVGVLAWGAAVLPLCWLKSMDAIAKMSILGVAANGIILLCIIFSAFEDKTEFHQSIKRCFEWANTDAINGIDKDGNVVEDAIRIRNKVNDLYGPNGDIQRDMFRLSNMWGAYGNFGFSFAVAVVTPSLIVGMKNPRHLGRVVWLSHIIITAIYAAIIAVSWWGWGNGVHTCRLKTGNDAKVGQTLEFESANIISSVFMRSLWVQVIAAVCLIISIMSSVPLFFFSIATMVEGQATKWWPNIHETTLRLVNRTILLFLCVAPCIPIGSTKLGDFQGLTGAVTTTTMCSILPNLLYLYMSRLFPVGHVFRGGNIGFMMMCAIGLAFGIFSFVVGFLADGFGLFEQPSVFDYPPEQKPDLFTYPSPADIKRWNPTPA